MVTIGRPLLKISNLFGRAPAIALNRPYDEQGATTEHQSQRVTLSEGSLASRSRSFVSVSE